MFILFVILSFTKTIIEIKNKKKIITVGGFLIIFIVLSVIFIRSISAQVSYWMQTDWSGGVSSEVATGLVDTYSSKYHIETDTAGQLTIEEQENWLGADWLYRKPLNINNPYDSDLFEYQIFVELNTSNFDYSNVNSDCSDIRFGDSEGNVLDYYQVSCNNSDVSEFWVKVDELEAETNSTIYLYYGNPGADSGSDIEETFSYSTQKTVGYVLQDELAASNLDVISLADDNEVSNGSTTLALNKQDVGTFPSNELSPNTSILAKKLFHADGENDNTDMIIPVGWATKEVYYNSYRDTNRFCMLSPWGDADVTIYDEGVLRWNGTVGVSGTCVTVNISDHNVYRISSDIPILSMHYTTRSHDTRVHYPATTRPLYGVPSNYLEIGAGPIGANVSWINSNGSSSGSSLGPNRGTYSGTYGAWGSPHSFKVSTIDNPIGVNQLADSDGGESSVFLPDLEMSTLYGSNNPAGYIAVAAPEPLTECTVYTNSGAVYQSATGGNRDDVNKIGFGTGSSSTILAAGWIMECDKPVYAYYEKDSNDSDETNLWTHQMMRRFVYPTPNIIGFEDEEYRFYEEGFLNSNVYDTSYASDWSDVTYSTNSTGTVEVRVRSDVSDNMAGALSFSSCDVLSNGDELSSNNCVEDTDRYLQYQVKLVGTEPESPEFYEISLGFEASDQTPPTENATDLSLDNAINGDWTNIKPQVRWTEGEDDEDGNGILGYCIALDEADIGASSLLDPSLSAGILAGIDDGVAADYCEFIATGDSIDLSIFGGLDLSTGNQYYFSIKAIDLAGNIWAGSNVEFQDLVSFKYDDTDPVNPKYVSLPGNFVSSKDVTFTWPISGEDAPHDDDSGFAGLQYKINENGDWFGDLHLGTNSILDLLVNDGSYTTDSTFDYPLLEEGSNMLYIRSYDFAGNVTEEYTTGVIKINSSAPSQVQNLDVFPSDNTQNQYSFTWIPPSTFEGQQNAITYCYTVNTLPSETTCSYTDPGGNFLKQ